MLMTPAAWAAGTQVRAAARARVMAARRRTVRVGMLDSPGHRIVCVRGRSRTCPDRPGKPMPEFRWLAALEPLERTGTAAGGQLDPGLLPALCHTARAPAGP